MNESRPSETNGQAGMKPLAQIMWDRRATRHFAPEPVPEQDLETMFALATQAPSGYNLQPWRFVVVRDPENRRRLRAAAMDQAKVSEAPVVLVAYSSRTALTEYADEIFQSAGESGRLGDSDPAEVKKQALGFIAKALPLPVWLNRHVMIAFTYLMLAAESLGWDTAPMEGFDPVAVRKVVGLPDDAEVVALLAIGRHEEPDAAHPGRLSVDKIFSSERHGTPWPAALAGTAAG